MSTHDTPRTSASIVAVDGNGLTLGNISRALSSSDVGRLIVMTSGNARQQVRKITQIVSNNQITIDHPFNEAAFPWITEVNPVLGDLCVFSYKITDLDPSDGDITLSNNNVYSISNLELDGGAYLHVENVDLRFNSQTFEIRAGGGLILGWYVRVAGEPARPIRTCSLRDSAPNSGGDSMRRTVAPASFGMYHQYGGGIYVPATCFWRIYQDTPDVDVRFIDVDIKGGFGARVDGTKSILIARSSNNRANVGLMNPRSAVAYSAISAINCLQVGYVWLREGASGKFTVTDAVDLDRGFRIFTSGGGAGEIFRIEGKKAQFDAFGIVYWAQGGDAFQHKVQFVNDIKPSFVNQDTTLHTGVIKTHLVNTNDVVIAAGTQTINNSQFEAVEGIYCEWTTKNNGQGSQNRRFTDPDTIVTAPYTITATAWGKMPLVQLISLEDTFDAQITLLDDATLTETDRAVVDAYENLDTAEKVYDAAMAWQADNPGELHGITRFGKTLDFGDSDVTFYEDWQPNTDYIRGQLLCHDDNLYIVNTNTHRSGNVFDATDLILINPNATTPFYFNGSVFICANTLDANIITTGSVTIIHGETSITGTIKDNTGVRLRLNLPDNSMIKGNYTPPGGAETAIAFETLAMGTKIITMPEDSSVTLYSKADGKLPRLDRFNVGAGLNFTPEQATMNGTVTVEAWTADISSTAWSPGNGGQITIQFNSLANVPVNEEGIMHLTSNDVAVFVNRVHFLENYANICLSSLGADHIVSNANRELEHEVAITLQLADGLATDVFFEFPFITFDPSDHTLLTPRNAAPNQRRCFIALSLRNTAKEITSIEIKRLVTEVVEPIATGVREALAGTNANTASLTDIGQDVEDVKANQEADHLTLVENIKPLPTFNTSSTIHSVAVANGIVTFTRNDGNPEDPLITYADLPATQRFTIGGETGATDMLIFVRNPGNAAETITIRPEFRVSGTADADVIAPTTLTLPADSLYQVMRFNIHGIHHNNEVDRISLDITGMGQGAAGGVEILQISAHRVGDPDDDVATDGTSGTETTLLEGIRDNVLFIKKTVG